MSPKLSRLLLIATVAAGFGVLPMQGALADSGVDVHNMPTGFSNGVPGVSGDCQSNDPNEIPHTIIHAKNTVTWYFKDGTHNVTPAEDVQSQYGHAANWPKGVGPSGDKTAPNDTFAVTFNNSGLYFYYSGTNNEGSDNHGQLRGMCGVVVVDVDTTPTTTTAPAPPTTTPDTRPPTTTPTSPPPTQGTTPTAPPTTSPSTHAPTTAAPAPTTTTAKVDKQKQPKDSSTTTSTTAPPAINIPPEAIIPDIAGTGAATQNGVVQPSSTPQGDAVALIKQKHSGNAKKLLILTGIGIGALGIGAGAYAWANRSSKYFPA